MFADQTSEGLRLQVERKNSVTVRCFHCLFGVYLKPRALLRITPRGPKVDQIIPQMCVAILVHCKLLL